jgi:hypothetical protein
VSFTAGDLEQFEVDNYMTLEGGSTARSRYDVASAPANDSLGTVAFICEKIAGGEPTVNQSAIDSDINATYGFTGGVNGTVNEIYKEQHGNVWFVRVKFTSPPLSGFGTGVNQSASYAGTGVRVSAIMAVAGHVDLTLADYVLTTGSAVTGVFPDTRKAIGVWEDVELFVDAVLPEVGTTYVLQSYGEDVDNQLRIIRHEDNFIRAEYLVGASDIVQIDTTTTFGAGESIKAVLRATSSGLQLWVNGTKATTYGEGTSSTAYEPLDTYDEVVMGGNPSGTADRLQGAWVSRFNVYTGLSEAQCADLSAYTLAELVAIYGEGGFESYSILTTQLDANPDASIVISPASVSTAGQLFVKSGEKFRALQSVRASDVILPDSDGVLVTLDDDVPPIGFDGSEPYLLPQGSATNLVLRSQEFDNASWGKAGTTVTPDAVTAPDNTITADKVTETAVTSNHNINSNTITVLNATVYTGSIYVKAAERSIFRLSRSGGVVGSSFDLSNQTVVNATGATGKIEDVGDGWYRCSLTFTTVSTSAAMYFELQTVQSVSSQSYLGDGTSGIYIWQAQVELGSFASTPIPTTTTTETRLADNLSISNVGDDIPQASGSIRFDATLTALSIARDLFTVSVDANNYYKLRISATNTLIFEVYSGGAQTGEVESVAQTTGTYQIDATYDITGDIELSIDSVSIGTDTPSAYPVGTLATTTINNSSEQITLITIQ